MIVDFIRLKGRLDKFAFGHLAGVHARDGSFLNLMRRFTIHEGDKSSYQTVDNETVPLNMEQVESVINIPNNDLSKLRFHEVIDIYERMASELLEKKQKQTLQQINDTVEAIGNTVDAKGRSFQESTLEMLEKLHIDFDEVREKPEMPTMIVNPATWEKLRAEEAATTEEERAEHERRQSEILDRKFEEYVLREGNRKLVD